MALLDIMKSIILSPILRPRLHRAVWLVWFVALKQLGFNLKKKTDILCDFFFTVPKVPGITRGGSRR